MIYVEHLDPTFSTPRDILEYPYHTEPTRKTCVQEPCVRTCPTRKTCQAMRIK